MLCTDSAVSVGLPDPSCRGSHTPNAPSAAPVAAAVVRTTRCPAAVRSRQHKAVNNPRPGQKQQRVQVEMSESTATVTPDMMRSHGLFADEAPSNQPQPGEHKGDAPLAGRIEGHSADRLGREHHRQRGQRRRRGRELLAQDISRRTT